MEERECTRCGKSGGEKEFQTLPWGSLASWCRECTNAFSNDSHKKKHIQIRSEVYAAYGNACQCCGESEPFFLTMDHINNDGNKQGRTRSFYKKIKQEGFPKDKYRLLCFNCNCGRAHNGGVCPHQER